MHSITYSENESEDTSCYPESSLSYVKRLEAVPPPPDLPPIDFLYHNGIADARKRHDALARRKYVKPFKWFKFNRARKATAK